MQKNTEQGNTKGTKTSRTEVEDPSVKPQRRKEPIQQEVQHQEDTDGESFLIPENPEEPEPLNVSIASQISRPERSISRTLPQPQEDWQGRYPEPMPQPRWQGAEQGRNYGPQMLPNYQERGNSSSAMPQAAPNWYGWTNPYPPPRTEFLGWGMPSNGMQQPPPDYYNFPQGWRNYPPTPQMGPYSRSQPRTEWYGPNGCGEYPYGMGPQERRPEWPESVQPFEPQIRRPEIPISQQLWDGIRASNERAPSTAGSLAPSTRSNISEESIIDLLKSQRLQQARIDLLEKENASKSESKRDGMGSNVDFLVSMQGPIEASAGEFRARSLYGTTLPDTWPRYVWPKTWINGRKQVVPALLALKRLQEKNTLSEAIMLMKDVFVKHGRTLLINEWVIIEPILSGKVSPDDYIFTHDCWEICLKGDTRVDIRMPEWLRICRTINTFAVNEPGEWNPLISGGLWPEQETYGINVGRIPSKRLNFTEQRERWERRQRDRIPPPQKDAKKKGP